MKLGVSQEFGQDRSVSLPSGERPSSRGLKPVHIDTARFFYDLCMAVVGFDGLGVSAIVLQGRWEESGKQSWIPAR